MTDSPPPIEDLALRVLAMPRDTNPAGDIFGGWVVSVMDMAGGTLATHTSKSRVVLAAIDKISFLRPVFVGDEVSCYARLIKIGTSSMQIAIEAWVRRTRGEEILKVTEGLFTFVAVDENRKPQPVQK
ncbi:MAG: Cytosolic long-chain acyl-CoA thioester hydrolase family protein [uncultured bacterium]|nr:MAG: Cytosolic long-chain acyl-CoA thioester hydrolase family protein [uncultured bacterium]OFW69777.1 MAG: acyl-CoA thioesterase [Alphaproteobacteria bacterium GWC2_42_16]OFW74376.1 MAG: acyl-CoA thioesterase [Alphaproteobacteria bacterium GWA2_41_27]OFW82525.1 MAG: acyl-CoA thioesterase [Alphaproteobacteria bacterium RIFCSPHIGHO2_12_FULL_42_100]OFW85113.1 MAG: acyl-CoA thioesterase [Alphaproteobacteria bacterium RBG_16_42_14]OFW91635.1 MAG: acyl-CoA thioesterase [Alphaproteobacteria bacte